MSRLPWRALPPTRSLPLLDGPATRALEQRTAIGLAPGTLMRRAGESIARLALALAPHADRIWVAAGPGNNGGDGIEAALCLTEAGKRIDITLMGDSGKLPADAAAALGRARAAGLSVGGSPRPVAQPSFAIDALLGVGSNRAPDGDLAEAIRTLNSLRVPTLAVDLPSGLGAATGEPFGADCVRATHTLSLLTLKPGLVTARGRDFAGTLWCDELGAETRFAQPGPAPTAWLSGCDPNGAAARLHAGNKGSFGDVVVVGGAASMTGAALLAARAALSAGAGRVYVDLLDRPPAIARLDLVHPELMFRDDWPETAGAALERATVVCGCGGGEAVRTPLVRLLDQATRLVIDADALNAIAVEPALAAALRARHARGQRTVLTPHPLEAARLLGIDVGAVQADRLAAARELAERHACVVLVKGSGTVIAAPGEVPRINATGNAALATAGTGDVLAGWLGGRWAQRHNGEDPWHQAFEVTCQAVAEHGAAAEPPPPGSLRAVDLIERLHVMRT